MNLVICFLALTYMRFRVAKEEEVMCIDVHVVSFMDQVEGHDYNSQHSPFPQEVNLRDMMDDMGD